VAGAVIKARGVETPPETAPWRIEDVIEEQ